MKIIAKNLKLSSANEVEINEAFKDIEALDLRVKMNKRTKEFNLSLNLTSPNGGKLKHYEASSFNFHQALRSLSRIVHEDYNELIHLYSTKRKKEFLKNRFIKYNLELEEAGY